MALDNCGNHKTYILNDGIFVDISLQSSYTQSGLNNKAIALLNPFRYRGYYYDVETGLYYLNSRYYDPEIGRFINADDISILAEGKDFFNGLNLYIYCFNNPVLGSDENGDIPDWLKWLITGIVAIATVALVVVITIATAGIATAVGSALGGGIAASIFGGAVGGAITGALTGFVMGAGINIISQGLSQGYENIDWSKVGMEGLIGAGIGALSGAIFGAVGKTLGLLGKTQWAQRVIPNLKNSKVAFMFGSKSGSFTFFRFGSGNGFFRLEASLAHGLHFHAGLTRAALTIPRTGLLTTIWNAIAVLGSYFGRNK